MIKRNDIVIDPNKYAEFLSFLRASVKSKTYWDDINKKASAPIDKAELDRLFEDVDA